MNLRRFLIITLVLAVIIVGVHAFMDKDDSEEQELLNKADKILEDVAKILGAEVKGNVKKGFKDRSDLVAVLEKMMEEEYSAEKFYREERTLKFFGLIPEDMNLEKKMKAFYLEQIGGFYDPRVKELYLIRMGQIPMLDNAMVRNTMMAHELCHAVQDMYVDLEKLIDEDGVDNIDLVMARQAVVEGQATLVMMQYLLKMPPEKMPDLSMMRGMMGSSIDVMGAEFQEFKNAPLYLKERLALFPYVDGAAFYRKFLVKFPDKKPIEIFDVLPLSTEQILHFDKYINKDYPQVLTLKKHEDILGEGWSLLADETLGEFDWKIFFTVNGDKATAERDAAGWDGSTFYLYERDVDKAMAMVLLSTWDSEADRNEAAQQYKKILENRYPDSKILKGSFDYSITDGEKSSILIKSDLDLIILERIPNDCLDYVLSHVTDYKAVEIRE